MFRLALARAGVLAESLRAPVQHVRTVFMTPQLLAGTTKKGKAPAAKGKVAPKACCINQSINRWNG